MRYISAICLLCCLWLVSCNNETKTEQTGDTVAEQPKLPPQSKLDSTGTQKLLSVLSSYYELKDALVATSTAKADEGATKLIVAANELDGYIKTDSINREALQPYLDTIKDGSNDILAVKDETTEKKRIAFENVSDAIYGLLRVADIKNAGVYRQYCPMAFNDKGAYWLSNNAEIRNPYFGKVMMECGEVTDSLK
jgi:Cu(I)/Ag(I) efflux system membrane fusion protein